MEQHANGAPRAPAPNLPGGTVVFLFTDIEGSTRLWQDRPAAMKGALARQRVLLEGCVERQGGAVFQVVGDGVSAAFATAPAALAAALAGQRAIGGERWPELGALRVRMAVHAGTAEVAPDDSTAGHYASSLTLSYLSRLLSAGHGGQVLVSAAVEALARGALPAGATLRDLGAFRLRDVAQPDHIYQLVASDLRADFPPLRAAAGALGNLPAQLTSFVGRESELRTLQDLLSRSRLLTLTGAGGTGKTRLAIQLALASCAAFGDGVWLAELAAISDPQQVAQAVATAFGLRPQPGTPAWDVLAGYLPGRDLLLVLDNCEHLLDACSALAAGVLQLSPNLKVLATSRRPLDLPGETTYRVPSLSLPEPGHDAAPLALLSYESVRLFVDRAQAANARFVLDEGNAPAVAQICRRLDGIPLAIELAASRVAALSPEQIAARLADYFRLLGGGSRSLLPRQRTLRALIDWSYDLLADDERLLLGRLSVFSGGFTLEAAERVCSDAAGPLPEAAVLDVLVRLVDCSLVQADTQRRTARYRLLEMIRQYAREKLALAGEEGTLHTRHLAFFVHLAEEAEPRLRSHEQVAWLDRLDLERDNMRAAVAWGLQAHPLQALRLASALGPFLRVRGLEAEARAWLEQALLLTEQLPPGAGPAADERARLLAQGAIWLAEVYNVLGDPRAAKDALERAIPLAAGLADTALLAWAKADLALMLVFLTQAEEALVVSHEALALARQTPSAFVLSLALDVYATVLFANRRPYDEARRAVTEALALLKGSGDAWSAAVVMYSAAMFTMYIERDFPAAQALFEESMATFARMGDRAFVNVDRSGLADLARLQGDDERASSLYREALLEWRNIGNQGAMARVLECLAMLAVRRGEGRRQAQVGIAYGARLLGAAERLREAARARMQAEEQADYAPVAERVRQAGAEAQAAWVEGRALSLPDVLEYAMHFPEA